MAGKAKISARIGGFLTFLKGYRTAHRSFRDATKRWPAEVETGYA
jgi:hypothetical protein